MELITREQTRQEYGFGSHLIVDLFGCANDKLADTDFIFGFLDNFPDKIAMTKVSPPQVFKYAGEAPENSGVSGVVLIEESHISIHTFPDKKQVMVNIFSCCKDFDIDHPPQVEQDHARRELKETFKSDSDKIELLGHTS